MSQRIENVAIAGATGNAGSPIFQALVASKLFTITVLTRKGSSSTTGFPSSVKIVPVDYNSVADLTTALQGQDALINATYIADPTPQINLIDAAVAAGVYRYIPSEYGLDTYQPAIAALPIFDVAINALKHMETACKAPGSKTTYTAVHNGGLLDWCFETGFLGLLTREKKATLYDEGDNEIAYTTREWAGRAVVAVLTHPEETKNRSVFVANAYVSQVQLLALAKEVSGAEGWEVTTKKTDDMLAAGYKELEEKGHDADIEVLLDFIRVADAKFETKWEKDDNELLGIPRFGDKEIKEVLKQFV